MSTQELRDRLLAELDKLSDDEADLDPISYLYPDGFSEGILSEPPVESIDEKLLYLDDIEEWQQLMKSAVQIEERFHGFEISLTDNFDSLSNQMPETVAETEAQTRTDDNADDKTDRKSLHEGKTDSKAVLGYIGGRADVPLSALRNFKGDGAENMNQKENQDQNDDEKKETDEQNRINIAEIKELIDFMTEAVERSAPILSVPILEARQTAVDWSLLPQMIGDYDDSEIPLQNATETDENLYRNDGNNLNDINGDHELQLSMQRQDVLKDSAEILRVEAEIAEQKAADRKMVLQERKRLIEEELASVRRDTASVRADVIHLILFTIDLSIYFYSVHCLSAPRYFVIHCYFCIHLLFR